MPQSFEVCVAIVVVDSNAVITKIEIRATLRQGKLYQANHFY